MRAQDVLERVPASGSGPTSCFTVCDAPPRFGAGDVYTLVERTSGSEAQINSPLARELPVSCGTSADPGPVELCALF